MNSTHLPKIKIVQYAYGASTAFSVVEEINRDYCRNHGYHYILSTEIPGKNRHPRWHKIPVMLEELKDCDYLLYLDSDIVFYSDEMSLENELIPLLGDKNILLTKDVAAEENRPFRNELGSSVILMKCNDAVRHFLDEWNRSSEIDVIGNWIPAWECINLRRMILPAHRWQTVVWDDYYTMGGRYGLFLRRIDPANDAGATTEIEQIRNRRRTGTYRSGLRIRVLQCMFGEFNYFRWSRKINSTYCRRHGYEYFVSESRPQADRHVVWQKMDAILESLDGCDYLVFLDADAIFYGQEFRIEELLLPLLGDKKFLMAQDITSEQIRWTPGYPNTGSILIRSDRSTKFILEEWNRTSTLDKVIAWTWPPEQLGLWWHILPRHPESFRVLDEYYMMNGIHGQFVRHYMIQKDDERTEVMKEYCRCRNLDRQSKQEMKKC